MFSENHLIVNLSRRFFFIITNICYVIPRIAVAYELKLFTFPTVEYKHSSGLKFMFILPFFKLLINN